MKKIILLFITLGLATLSHAQLTKADAETIIKNADVTSLEKIFLTFKTNESATKHKMNDENLASYESLDPKTATIEFTENYLHISGKTYDAYIPYDKIKFIHVTKGKSLQIKISE
jgi:hypothetical protein